MAQVASAWPAMTGRQPRRHPHARPAHSRPSPKNWPRDNAVRFEGDHWKPGPYGLPIIDGVTSWMLGRIIEVHPVHNNAVIVVADREGALGEPDEALLYHERAYRDRPGASRCESFARRPQPRTALRAARASRGSWGRAASSARRRGPRRPSPDTGSRTSARVSPRSSFSRTSLSPEWRMSTSLSAVTTSVVARNSGTEITSGPAAEARPDIRREHAHGVQVHAVVAHAHPALDDDDRSRWRAPARTPGRSCP